MENQEELEELGLDRHLNYVSSLVVSRNWCVCNFLNMSELLDNMQDVGTQEAIDVRETIVVITVSDLAKSRERYSRLVGKAPDLEPFPGNVEFRVGRAWAQIMKGKVQASSWSLQLEVRDVSPQRERLRGGGIPAIRTKTVPNVIS